MKKYLNLIISGCSLVVTVTLLIISMFAWYIVNETATVMGIIAQTDSVKGSFDFYYFNDTSEEVEGELVESGRWVKTNNDLRITDAWPTDVFYFKIVGSRLQEGQKLSIKFSGVQSIIDTKVVTGHKNDAVTTTKTEGAEPTIVTPLTYDVRYEGIPGYTSSTTTFNVDYNGTTKTLYQLEQNNKFESGYEVTLKDIQIKDCFKIYTAPTFKTAAGIDDFPSGKGSTSINITDSFFNQEVTAADNGSKTIYFSYKMT